MLRLSLLIISNIYIILIFSSSFSEVRKDAVITSDKLYIYKKRDYMHFLGNVTALFDGNILKAGKVVIYKKSEKEIKDKDSIEKIVAEENVDIRTAKNKRINSNYVEFFTDKKLLILKGKDSKIVDENSNVITADRIEYYYEKDEIVAEGNENKPMEIIIKDGIK